MSNEAHNLDDFLVAMHIPLSKEFIKNADAKAKMTYYYHRTSRRAIFISSMEEEIIRTIQGYVDRYNSKGIDHGLTVPKRGKIKRAKELELSLGYEQDDDPEPAIVEANEGIQFMVYDNAIDPLTKALSRNSERLKRGDLYKVETPFDRQSNRQTYLPLELVVRLKRFVLSKNKDIDQWH